MSKKNQSLSPVYDPILTKCLLFKGMSKLEINAASAFLEQVKIKKGDYVFKEGDDGDHMFILLSGKLGAYVIQPDGTHRRMFDIKIGDFFGEMSIITNEPRSATLTAIEDTEIMALPGIDFYRIIFEHPMIGVKMLKAICRVQNRWLDEKTYHLSDLTRWGETAQRRAFADELTSLYNRRFLDDSIKGRFAKGSIGIRTMSLLMMDLDKIHEINERHGIAGGDHVFQVVANVLRSCTRPGDICARLAGDEFAVFLPDTDLEEAKRIAERIRATVEKQKIPVPKTPDAKAKVEIGVRTSVGVAVAPLHAKSRETLFLLADKALAKAKEKGRNRVEVAE